MPKKNPTTKWDDPYDDEIKAWLDRLDEVDNKKFERFSTVENKWRRFMLKHSSVVFSGFGAASAIWGLLSTKSVAMAGIDGFFLAINLSLIVYHLTEDKRYNFQQRMAERARIIGEMNGVVDTKKKCSKVHGGGWLM